MKTLQQLGSCLTELDYWLLESETPIKHEFLEGRAVAMAFVTMVHTTIMGNVAVAIRTQVRGRPPRVAASQQRLKIAAVGYQTYPDVVVSCPPFQFDPKDGDTLTDATVVVEILSPSTADYDRNLKFDAYKQLPSLRHYLLIAQTPFDVVHHFKDENGDWRNESLAVATDVVRLTAIDCHLSLSEIYEDIELDLSR